jgi:hypothetical protein
MDADRGGGNTVERGRWRPHSLGFLPLELVTTKLNAATGQVTPLFLRPRRSRHLHHPDWGRRHVNTAALSSPATRLRRHGNHIAKPKVLLVLVLLSLPSLFSRPPFSKALDP